MATATPSARTRRRAQASPANAVKAQRDDQSSILRALGVVGLDAIEPVILAALATEAPLLLVGPHGTAKSLLLSRLCEALGLEWRHYNTSLLNYDDLVGYPLPDAEGRLRFIETPASIWNAEAVFLDEISRCRPDIQNRLFPIIHERKVLGLPLPRLRYRWAAMNPPADAESFDDDPYAGSVRLDDALADRFPFIVRLPSFAELTPSDRDAVIRQRLGSVTPEASQALRDRITTVRRGAAELEAVCGPLIARYVDAIAVLAGEAGWSLSGRRATMLFGNIVAVTAAFGLDASTSASAATWAAPAVAGAATAATTFSPVAWMRVTYAHAALYTSAAVSAGTERPEPGLSADSRCASSDGPSIRSVCPAAAAASPPPPPAGSVTSCGRLCLASCSFS